MKVEEIKPTGLQISRAGEFFVAAELNRRGAYAVTFAGNMPRIDIIASNLDQSHTVKIQVITRHKGRHGGWQSRLVDPAMADAGTFWILVDLATDQPEYYIMPETWLFQDIYNTHQRYLAKHGGERPISPESKHHLITRDRVEQWKDRWDLLKIF